MEELQYRQNAIFLDARLDRSTVLFTLALMVIVIIIIYVYSRIMLPDYTSEMTVSLTTCVKQGMANMSDDWECPLVITSAAGRLPDLYTSYNSSHELRVISPGVNVWNYIMVYMPFGHQETVECELVVTVSSE